MKPLIAFVSVCALGAVVAAIWIGSQASEKTVVDHPYEHGLHYDDQKHARERAGWQAHFEGPHRPGGERLAFALVDRTGAPVDGATIQVAVARPAGPGDERQGAASSMGGGRYQADLGFAAPGFWDVRLDVTRGEEKVALVQQVHVEAAAGAAAPCALAAAPCTVEAGGLAVTLDLGRTLATMKDLPATVEVRRGGAPLDGATVEVSFAMRDMNMGENRVVLAAAGPGRYGGKAVLVRCHSGSRDWIATVTVRRAGAPPASAAFPFAVVE